DRVDDRHRLATALTALASLRRPEREVITLCLGEGLDYEAAAEALGIPVGTVASRLSRARKKLRSIAEAQLAMPQLAVEQGVLGRTASDIAFKKVREKREGTRPVRQTRGDHVNAIRPAQEGNR
ncbi:sigma-70 family RNA polymerase sigma factor, partial [Streptomyces sp. NPDC047868]